MRCGSESLRNIERAESMVRMAAQLGAHIILLQELFATLYFCKDQDPIWFEQAKTIDDHPAILRLRRLAQQYEVVLPLSFFERSNNRYFNSLVIIDADGEIRGLYRKSHLPDGPGYYEKFYFMPGNEVCVITTRYCRIGCGICWDQWFPELARTLTLNGAELIVYPSAIGSEPEDRCLDSRDHWMRVIQGHAAANMVPIMIANRVGEEVGTTCSVTFYGSSFIAGPIGEILIQHDRFSEGIITALLDLNHIAAERVKWGLLNDRRPELYY